MNLAKCRVRTPALVVMFGCLVFGEKANVKTGRKGGLSSHLCKDGLSSKHGVKQADEITPCAIACVLSLRETKNG